MDQGVEHFWVGFGGFHIRSLPRMGRGRREGDFVGNKDCVQDWVLTYRRDARMDEYVEGMCVKLADDSFEG